MRFGVLHAYTVQNVWYSEVQCSMCGIMRYRAICVQSDRVQYVWYSAVQSNMCGTVQYVWYIAVQRNLCVVQFSTVQCVCVMY